MLFLSLCLGVLRGVDAEQLLHELEQKYFALQSDFAVCDAERQALATDKQAAGTRASLLATACP